MQLAQGKLLTELNRGKPASPLRDCEFRVFSQWGEDGIIQKLITSVPIKHDTFIEFGVEDFAESNCRFLMMNNNWRGFVIDGSQRWIAALRSTSWFWKYDLRAECAMVTRENLNELLASSGFDHDLGILSIDVDGMDYWLLEALEAFAPRILIVEYNSLFGSERLISVPYDATFSRREKHFSGLYYGASLPAFTRLAHRKGYALVGTESAGVNAFFVRKDLLQGGLRALSVEEAFTAARMRSSYNRDGRLDFLRTDERYEAIRGLPVVNVVTGTLEEL
jgi:hypothetical protein